MITVSVCMITYGHEHYIREAINGILMQETDFNIELVIGNDTSPDNTDAVIQNIITTHPKGHLIKYTNHASNLGIMPNLLFVIEQCKGKYIAMCEGDDYWTDKHKLQKQVNILEEDNAIGLVYTGVTFYHQKEDELITIPSRFAKRKEDVIPLMLESKFIEFPTTIFRTTVLNNVINTIKVELLDNAVIGDTRILLETAYQSDIYFLEDVTTVYRVAEGSASYPKDIDKYIHALMDTYQCRVNFVKRHNLDTKLLASTICNTNKNLINKAFTSKKYKDILKLIKGLLIKETFKNCDLKTINKKMSIAVMLKLFLAPLGIGILKTKLTK